MAKEKETKTKELGQESQAATPAKPKSPLLVPPDGGWGWVIVIAVVINLMVIPTTLTCFGVMVPFIIKEFDANIGAVSWVPGIAVAVLNLLGPWTSAMLGLYSHRRLGMIGSFIVFVAVAVSSAVPSVMILFATYGLVLGFGCALSSTVGMLILQEYFAQRRPLANGLMMAGGSVGQMVIPLLIQGLFQGYGMRGGMLIYSAIVLQSFVACALFQPSRWHWKLASPPPAEQMELLEKKVETPPNALPPHVVNEVAEKDARARSNSWTAPNIAKHEARRLQRMNSHQEDRARSSSMASHKEPGGSVNGSFAALSYIGSVGSIASLAPVNLQVLESPIQMSLDEMRRQLKTRNQVDNRAKWLRWMPRCPPANKILHVPLMKNPFFIILCVAQALGRLTYQQFNVLVPSYARSLAVDPTSAASLVTILAASDTVARLCVPILADKLSRYSISTLNVCLTGFVVCALGSFAIAMSTDFTGLVISCIIYGIGIGGITGLTVVVIVQSLGMASLTPAFGINVFIGGCIVFPGIIIIGYIQVLTQSYSICFHVVGGICVFSALIWAPLPVILRRLQQNVNN